ncbi:GNAT family N-acetyltransferase [Cohnella sp. WQ 127256]|uniref:GNAT family N-acetyltransferase n=1 Tax=Cohnella sp. WQ 127256 TaxID=2938790 RepID=UPI002117F3D6|nr:GNAT family N-acetyltransferase [Cohnella sp. WQ 127256]
MIVWNAIEEDIASWLRLASEVEYLFGLMAEDPIFLQALQKNISRGSAFCIRENDGPPGSSLLGGLLFSSSAAPLYNIGWLAVASRARKSGVATALMTYVLTLVPSPAEVTVTTFGTDIADGLPARELYIKNGFKPDERVANGPEGGSRQKFKLKILERKG